MRAPARVLRLLGVEATKVVGGRGFLVGLVAVAAGTALSALLHERAGREETPWTLAASAFSAGLWVAEIFLLVAGATAIAGETAAGTLKMVLPHAYRRSDWIAAKSLVLAAQAAVLLAVAAAVALAGATVAGGLDDVVRVSDEPGLAMPPETLQTAGEMTGYVVAAAGVALAALVATAWLGLLVSCAFDAVVPAVSTGFLLFLGLESADTVFGAGEDVLAWVWSWYPGAMLDRVEALGKALSERWNERLAPKGLLLSAGVAALAVLGSLAVFTRRDLQS